MTQPGDRYSEWVERVAAAIHEDCLLEWQGIAVVDPKRQVTKHMADAHYGRAHDLVRRLSLAAQPAPPTEALADLDVAVALLAAIQWYVDGEAKSGLIWPDLKRQLDHFLTRFPQARRYLAATEEGTP